MLVFRQIRISLCALCAVLTVSCMSTGDRSASVTRISAEAQRDLSGYWNDTDVQLVADHLVRDCTASAAITTFAAKNGRLPIVIVGAFRNQSDEHIDTAILTKTIENALLNSGTVDFVADAAERERLRAERFSQQSFASPATAKQLKNETGADFMLFGSVKTIIDSAGNQTLRSYFVSADIIAIETAKVVWSGDDSSIKKLITRSNYRL